MWFALRHRLLGEKVPGRSFATAILWNRLQPRVPQSRSQNKQTMRALFQNLNGSSLQFVAQQQVGHQTSINILESRLLWHMYDFSSRQPRSYAKASMPAVAADQMPSARFPFTSSPEAVGFCFITDQKSLQAHVEAGRVKLLDARGQGFGSSVLRLTVRNLTAASIHIVVPRGSLFCNNDEGLQPLICAEDAILEVGPHSEETQVIDAFCGLSSHGRLVGSPMVPTPYLLHSPSAMASQRDLWAHLQPYSPHNSGTLQAPIPSTSK
jgi:hypothetical protein